MRTFIENKIQNNISTTQEILTHCVSDIEKVIGIVFNCLKNGNTVYWCGNGGSAGQAQHLSAELVGGFHDHHRPAFRSISLTTDTSFITAWGNDTSFDTIFSRQVEGLCKSGDVLIGITTSGNSRNIIEAVQLAKIMDVTTIVFTGASGGKVGPLADYAIKIPSDETQHIQEGHILVGHILCEIVEKELS